MSISYKTKCSAFSAYYANIDFFFVYFDTVALYLLTSFCFPNRMTVLAAICLTQAFMMWKFINFQLRRWREHAEAHNLKKKQVPTKSKSKKDKGE